MAEVTSSGKFKPAPPFKVNKDKSKGGVELTIEDSAGHTYEIAVFSTSQVPLPLRDLEKMGITFSR